MKDIYFMVKGMWTPNQHTHMVFYPEVLFRMTLYVLTLKLLLIRTERPKPGPSRQYLNAQSKFHDDKVWEGWNGKTWAEPLTLLNTSGMNWNT